MGARRRRRQGHGGHLRPRPGPARRPGLRGAAERRRHRGGRQRLRRGRVGEGRVRRRMRRSAARWSKVNASLADKPRRSTGTRTATVGCSSCRWTMPKQLNELLGPDDYAEALEEDERVESGDALHPGPAAETSRVSFRTWIAPARRWWTAPEFAHFSRKSALVRREIAAARVAAQRRRWPRWRHARTLDGVRQAWTNSGHDARKPRQCSFSWRWMMADAIRDAAAGRSPSAVSRHAHRRRRAGEKLRAKVVDTGKNRD